MDRVVAGMGRRSAKGGEGGCGAKNNLLNHIRFVNEIYR